MADPISRPPDCYEVFPESITNPEDISNSILSPNFKDIVTRSRIIPFIVHLDVISRKIYYKSELWDDKRRKHFTDTGKMICEGTPGAIRDWEYIARKLSRNVRVLKNTNTRTCYKFDGNYFLVQSSFTLGQRTVPSGKIHLYKVGAVRMLLYYLRNENSVVPVNRIFKPREQYKFRLSILQPYTSYTVPENTTYYILTTDKCFFALYVVKKDATFNFEIQNALQIQQHRRPAPSSATYSQPPPTPLIEDSCEEELASSSFKKTREVRPHRSFRKTCSQTSSLRRSPASTMSESTLYQPSTFCHPEQPIHVAPAATMSESPLYQPSTLCHPEQPIHAAPAATMSESPLYQPIQVTPANTMPHMDFNSPIFSPRTCHFMATVSGEDMAQNLFEIPDPPPSAAPSAAPSRTTVTIPLSGREYPKWYQNSFLYKHMPAPDLPAVLREKLVTDGHEEAMDLSIAATQQKKSNGSSMTVESDKGRHSEPIVIDLEKEACESSATISDNPTNSMKCNETYFAMPDFSQVFASDTLTSNSQQPEANTMDNNLNEFISTAHNFEN